MALDHIDRELLRRMDLHGYYTPNSVDERLRLVRLAELGLVQSKLEPFFHVKHSYVDLFFLAHYSAVVQFRHI